ncbi:MAG TPA: hypothetical protein PKO22_10690 [Treponemataceae bacterium]|nr:hypothetical protein [Treponemataceae bacterium]
MKRFIVMFFTLLFVASLFGDGKYKEEDFVGLWYFIDGDEHIDANQWVTIEKTKSGLQVRYNDGKCLYSGVLELMTDGRNLKGVLTGLGGVVIGKVRSLSEIENNGIYLDLSGGPDDILLGDFQRKEVLEKLIGKKLPATK